MCSGLGEEEWAGWARAVRGFGVGVCGGEEGPSVAVVS
jgi:hypothetical protein